VSLQWSGHHDHSDETDTATSDHTDPTGHTGPGPEAAVIEVRSLTKRYGDRRAVDDLTFTAPAGRVTGFLGPNGAGKTTTFRCLLGLAEPTSGEALVDGRRYRELAAPRRQVGAVLESTGFHPSRRGRDHLRVLARSAGLDERRIDAVLTTVGLGDAAARPVGGYSLGMKQRLGLAGALLGDPPVVVLDEPANGLDPEGVRWVRQLLRVWADEGRTVLVSSHQLAEIAQVVDRVVIVRDGTAVVETELTRPSGAEALERLFLEAMGGDRPHPISADAGAEVGEVRP
jgi:ABC-2 type transport system ATP-binding protein